MSILLLLLLGVGFAQTLFLRSFFGTIDPASGLPGLPWHLYLHGAVLSGWFCIFFAQTSLVAAGRINLHRRLGIAGVVLAVLVIIVGIWTVAESIPRNVLAGMPLEARRINLFGNAATLLPFGLCVAKAIARRREPDAHKRLMLFASIAIIGQATQRIGFLIGFNPIGPLSLVALPLAVIGYDLLTRRRIHWATVWGTTALLASIVLSVVVARSPIGSAVLERVYAP